MNTIEVNIFIKKCHLGILPRFEETTGIPEWFYNLVVGISEDNLNFIRDCYSLLRNNTNMIKVRQQFIIHILEKNNTYYDLKKFKEVYKSNEDIIQLWKIDPTGSNSAAWSAARSAAWSAAWSAAESAAESAAWSAAESAARSAAYVEIQQSLLKIIKENSIL